MADPRRMLMLVEEKEESPSKRDFVACSPSLFIGIVVIMVFISKIGNDEMKTHHIPS